ncbi:MAG TPA: HAMP domain-containing methyl-accepting chemotaxis protein [Bacillales bacterium]|nr:HAMP domain-containing methyl-accepting chemotaxis protein [Bacillales bacterium]
MKSKNLRLRIQTKLTIIIVISLLISSPIAAYINGLISDYYSGSLGVYINTLVSLIITTGIIIICIRFILVRPLQELLSVTKKVAKGDLTAKVAYQSKDEIGELAKGFNEMIDHLHELIGKVSVTGKKVSSVANDFSDDVQQTTYGAGQISQMMQEMASGSDVQLRGAEESTKVLEEMTNGIQSIAESASDVSNKSVQAKDEAVQGREHIQRSKQQMVTIREVTEQAVDEINSLYRSSEEIGEIIEVITDIANQTNLLSLNAEIEAARAGEHGKGFAVVAGEVRKLAEQSEQSADKIVQLIRGIQDHTTRTAKVMGKGSDEVQKGTAAVDKADRTFGTIVEVIETVANKTQDVSAAVEEISANSQQIVTSSEQTAAIAQESVHRIKNVASTSEGQQDAMERVSEYARSLRSFAEELNQSVQQFQVR